MYNIHIPWLIDHLHNASMNHHQTARNTDRSSTDRVVSVRINWIEYPSFDVHVVRQK